MFTMLAEAATANPGNVQTIVTTVIASLAGLEAVRWGKGRFKNGNGKCQPGHTTACIEHLTRLGRLEEAVKYVRKDLKRAEHNLGGDLKDIKGKLDEALKR